MNKLTITLKQHTPLLHFQPMQEGATLRASEVKPKLDKFLIKAVSGKGYKRGLEETKLDDEKKKWFIGESNALDYKMKITSSDIVESIKMRKNETGELDEVTNEKKYDTPNYPNNMNSLIMGNMGGRTIENVLNFVMYENITLTIMTEHAALKDVIVSNLVNFFNETCFGNRSSKGFGSYSIKKIEGYNVQLRKPSYDFLASFSLESKNGDSISRKSLYVDVFTVINRIWKALKKNSGKPGKHEESTLLASTLGRYHHDRIPSIIRFKPHITPLEDNKYEVYLAMLIDLDVTPYTLEFSKGVREYVQTLKKGHEITDEIISKLKLQNQIVENSVKIDL